MAEDTVNSQEEFVDVTDEQADKMFENGGVLEVEDEPEVDVTEEKALIEGVNDPVEEPESEEKKEEKKVNLGALHEERMKRKELQEKVEKMDKRFQQILESLQPKEEVPSIDVDPVTNFDTRIQQVEQFAQQQTQQVQQQQMHTQVVTAYQAQAAEYASKNPEFTDAYQYLVKNRIEELKTFGYDDAGALQAVQQEEFGMALKSLQDGVNPAERIHQIAKYRGYQGKKPEVQTQAKNLEVINKGQQSAKPSSGGAPAGELTMESLAEMSDEEFNANWDKIVGKK